ncbi:MAG: CoA-binding protein [Chloroflexota bacterium]
MDKHKFPRGGINMRDEQPIEKIMAESNTIAVVGFSSNPQKAGYYVPAYLKRQGYAIYAVNPNVGEGLGGEPAYGTLGEVPTPVDLVLIFQRSENVPPFVDQAIEIGAKAVWMQLGIANEAAAQKAEAAGLDVVQNACMLVEHKNWDRS